MVSIKKVALILYAALVLASSLFITLVMVGTADPLTTLAKPLSNLVFVISILLFAFGKTIEHWKWALITALLVYGWFSYTAYSSLLLFIVLWTLFVIPPVIMGFKASRPRSSL